MKLHERKHGLHTPSPTVEETKLAPIIPIALASHLKNAPGRPVQMTKTAIGRDLGAVTLLQQNLDKMPLTAQALASVAETREQYAVRRVWWATDSYCQEHILPREWQLALRR